MTNQPATLHVGRIPRLGELFKLFNTGRHLNRVAEPALWAELEQEQEQYQALFSSLGYQLRVDARGFAWFHFDNANSAVNATTRQLALLLMLIFEHMSDQGLHLGRFGDWILDRDLLAALMERSHDLLQTEGLDEQNLAGLLDRACNYGLAEVASGGWRLLPAVWRYLDHFESLAAKPQDADDAASEVLQVEQTDDEGEEP